MSDLENAIEQRARRLARRFALSLSVARALVELHFSPRGAR